MTLLPSGVKVHLALGFINMRKGIDGLAMLVQGVLQQDPFSGHLFVFRGRTRANLIKIIHWDGTGLCLFTKRLEHGVFLWPPSIDPGKRNRSTQRFVRLLMKDALRRTVEIFVLPAPKRPHERQESREPEADRNWYEIIVVRHSAASAKRATCAVFFLGDVRPASPERRSAFRTTRIEEPDIATAATSGVT